MVSGRGRSCATSVVLATVLGSAGTFLGGACTFSDLDLSTRQCPCAEGWTCVANRCVPEAAEPLGADGGPTSENLGVPDAGIRDPVGFDAGSTEDPVGSPVPPADAGAVDTGVLPELGVELDTTSATEVVVRVGDQFELAFSSAHGWQPAYWVDLESDPSRNLVQSSVTVEPKHRVLFSPLGILYGPDWYTLNAATTPTIETARQGPDQVRVTTRWTWVMPDSATFDMTADYTITADGSLAAVVTLVPDQPRTLGAIEYAYVNVDPALPWSATESADERRFELRVAAGPTLVVTADAPTLAPAIRSDMDGNRYFMEFGDRSIGLAPLETRFTLQF